MTAEETEPTKSPITVPVRGANLIDEGVRYRSFGGREQSANIEDPKTAANILNHPKSLMS